MYKTIITFVCNRKQVKGQLQFDHLDSDSLTYYFKMETSLACSPELVQCKLTGPDGKMYNLEPLIKKEGNTYLC